MSFCELPGLWGFAVLYAVLYIGLFCIVLYSGNAGQAVSALDFNAKASTRNFSVLYRSIEVICCSSTNGTGERYNAKYSCMSSVHTYCSILNVFSGIALHKGHGLNICAQDCSRLTLTRNIARRHLVVHAKLTLMNS